MSEFLVSKKQAQEFTKLILSEIHTYVNANLQAYEEFQRMELNSKFKGDNHYEN